MREVTIIGHFGFGYELNNGQTVKTKVLAEALKKRFGNENVVLVDTHGGLKRVALYPFIILKELRKSKNIVTLPAHNGLKILAPLLVIENIFFKRKLHYVVIGGWLPRYLKKHKLVRWFLRYFTFIYVETTTMQTELRKSNYSNVLIMPNCKEVTIKSIDELSGTYEYPLKLCTFSRVMREKGIDDAIDAVRTVNESTGEMLFSLDIYGSIEPEQNDWFDELREKFPKYIQYCGEVPYAESVNKVSHYFVLLFPTRFYTEGIPGTIIDAYASGVPVVSAKWESYTDVIKEGVTGIGYAFGNINDLIHKLKYLAENPKVIVSMKKACLEEAKKYLPETAIDILVERF